MMDFERGLGGMLADIAELKRQVERLQTVAVPKNESFGEAVLGSPAAAIAIGGLPSTGKHLRITAVVRNSGASGAVGLQFNLDNGASYSRVNAFLLGSTTWTVQDAEVVGTNYLWVGSTTASTDESGQFGVIEVFVPYYASTTYKKTGLYRWGLHKSAAANAFELGIGRIAWHSTAAITRVDIFNATGGVNFDTGSAMTIAGLNS